MSHLARLFDANFNRASEGLRLLEDVARFILNSSDLTTRAKDLRHALRDIAGSLAASNPALDPVALLASRDTPGDVGTSISTPSELRRETLASAVASAAGRTAEAIRVIEEAAKLSGVTTAAQKAEAARYSIYELHKRIALALGTGRAQQWSLCVLLSEHLCTHMHWLKVAELAIEGGADCLQLREKTMDGGELLARARSLIALARPAGVTVFINDRPDIAMLSGADGVHVGQHDLPLTEVRKLAGLSLLVGVSTGNLDEARRAVLDGADVCGVGPMFPTQTKHKPILAGPDYLAAYLADPTTARTPHLAIGGIGPENVSRLAETGGLGVAVSSCVCSAPDPAEVCRALRRSLKREPAPEHARRTSLP
jgi:thiamine-phosphate pyrophosphorylase